jgi:L-threonylcarbamoyladenylate synthase
VFSLRIQQAADALLAGGVVAYPTEAVYGIGCLPLEVDAVARILRIKNRSASKGLILIAAHPGQLDGFIRLPDSALRRDILNSWPGPSTWLLPAAPGIPDWLTGGRATLAVRVTAHPLAAELCRRCESPLVSTSANRAGRPPLTSALGVRRQLGNDIDYLLAGALGEQRRPTQIRDGATGAMIRAS